MSTATWRGDARAIAQVDTVQITLYHVDTTYTLTIGERTISVAANVDVNTSASDLKDAWNASAYPEAMEVTATVNTDTVTLTADTAGLPFTVTSSKSGTGTIDPVASSTANSGPNDVSVSDNWTGGSGTDGIPADTDNVIVENSSVSLLYNLDQNAVTPASLKIKASFTGTIGLPRLNTAGTDYLEYRDTYWKVGNTADATNMLVDIGEGEGNGSGRIKLDYGTGQATTTVFKTGTRAETGIPCLLLQGSKDTNVFAFNRGDVGLGFFGGETCTFETMRVGYISGATTDALVTGGDDAPQKVGGVITQTGGVLVLSDLIKTAKVTGGTFTLRETATATTITVHDATLYYESSALLGTLNVGAGATADYRRNGVARIVTTANCHEGGSIYDPAATVTWTNDIDLEQCGYEDVTLQLGKHITAKTTAL